MIISRRFLMIDTPSSSMEPIAIKSVVIRFSEGNGEFRDASVASTTIEAMNHIDALRNIQHCKWSEPQPLNEGEYKSLIAEFTETPNGISSPK